MGFFDGSNPWNGGGMMGGNNYNQQGGAEVRGGYAPYMPQMMPDAGWYGSYSPAPFSSFGRSGANQPALQGPAGGPAPMQPTQSPPDPFLQMGSQPSPFTALGGVDASGRFMNQQQGPLGQTSPATQQPSNPFASLGRFGW